MDKIEYSDSNTQAYSYAINPAYVINPGTGSYVINPGTESS